MPGQDDSARAPAGLGPSTRKGRATAQDWFGEAQVMEVDDRSMPLESTAASPERRPSLREGAYPGTPGSAGPVGGYLTDESPTVGSPHESLPPEEPVNYRSRPPSPRHTGYSHDEGHRDQHWQRRGTYSGPTPKTRGTRWNDLRMGSYNQSSQYFSTPEDGAYRNGGRGNYRGRGGPYHPTSRTYIVPKGAIVPPLGPMADATRTDPRRLNRVETAPPITTEERDASASAVTYEHHRRTTAPSSMYSGSRTPQSPGTSMTPEDRIESLTAVLDEFTTHISKMTSITTQRDTAKNELAKREQDYDKSRKYHAAFPKLADQQGDSRVKAQKKFEELDRQLEDHVSAREKLSKTIASRLMSQANAKDSQTIRRLEAELGDMSKQVKNLKSTCGQIHALQGKVDGFKTELGHTHTHFSDMQADFAALRDRVIPSLEKLEGSLSDLPNLKVEVGKIRNDLEGISKAGEKTASEVGGLKETIHREHGLADEVLVATEYIKKHKENFKEIENNFEQYDADLNALGARLEAVEEQAKEAVEKAGDPAPAVSPEAAADSDAVAAVRAELEGFREEQQQRDDIVGDSIEKAQKTGDKAQSDLGDLRRTFEDAVKRADEWMSKLERMFVEEKQRFADANANTATKSTAPADAVGSAAINAQGSEAVKEIQDTVREQQKAVAQLGQYFRTLKYTVENLDSRFNKLTTQELARYMIKQLSEMYPHASTIQASFDQIKQESAGIQTRLEELAQKIESLSIEQRPAPPDTVNGEEVEERDKKTYLKEEVDKKVADLEKGICDVIKLHQESSRQVRSLEETLTSINASSSKELALLQVQVDNLNKHNKMHISQAGEGEDVGTSTSVRAAGESGRSTIGEGDRGGSHEPQVPETQAGEEEEEEDQEDHHQQQARNDKRKRKREDEIKSRRSSKTTTYVLDSDDSETVHTPRRSKRNRRRGASESESDNNNNNNTTRGAGGGRGRGNARPARRARKSAIRDYYDEDLDDWLDEQLAG